MMAILRLIACAGAEAIIIPEMQPAHEHERPTRNTMACLECGYALDGLKSLQCPECGRDFDPSDPQTWRRVLHDAARIGRFLLTEAHAICMYLESHDVPAAVHPEAGGVIAYVPLPQASLWVDRPDVERARQLLADMNAHGESSEPDEPWTCAQCGERIEAGFDICWNCGAERTEA
jgi:predicted amidophosphoribosyltransferase